MKVNYVKYLKILSIPEREERILRQNRTLGEGWRVVKVKGRGESDSDVETELRDRRGGRRTFQLVIKTCRAVTLAPTPSRHSSAPTRYNEALALLYRRRRHRRHLVN